MKCKYCKKTLPISVPIYHRGHFDHKKRKYIPNTQNICLCDKEEYKFMIVGAVNQLNKRKGLPIFTEEEFEELYKDKLEKREIWKKISPKERYYGEDEEVCNF